MHTTESEVLQAYFAKSDRRISVQAADGFAALKAVLPRSIRVFPVGGIGASDIPAWLAAGADGFGFGSELFRPDYSLEDIGARARELVRTLHESRALLAARPPT